MNYILNNFIAPYCLPLVINGWFPDFLIRFGIRKLLQSTLDECKDTFTNDVTKKQQVMNKYIDNLKERPIAENTQAANDQHYMVNPELYQLMLGKNLKYSCCLFDEEHTTLSDAEDNMLSLVCKRADITNKPLKVLDLGCGWGSCGLYIAKRFPNVEVTMVSNSSSQREFLLRQVKDRNLTNVKDILTMDANVMTFPLASFDRIVSNEMFEHMKNYEKLFEKVSSWLKPNGLLFVHIFVHDHYAYHYEKGWMAEKFFTGGMMPSRNLFLHFQKDLIMERQWSVNGINYSKTSEEWLKRLDMNKKSAISLLGSYENYFNWRLFHLACSELFKFNNGNEWYIQHYLFIKR